MFGIEAEWKEDCDGAVKMKTCSLIGFKVSFEDHTFFFCYY